MKELIARTRTLFNQGMPLAKMVDIRLSIDLEMFSRGGLAVLDAIEVRRLQHAPASPVVGKAKQAGLLGRLLLTHTASRLNRKSPTEFVKAQHAAPQTPRPKNSTKGLSSSSSPSNSLIPIPASYEACLQVAKASHSNFYYAFFLLPNPAATASSLSTPSCASSTTSPTKAKTSAKNSAAWPAGALLSMPP